MKATFPRAWIALLAAASLWIGGCGDQMVEFPMCDNANGACPSADGGADQDAAAAEVADGTAGDAQAEVQADAQDGQDSLDAQDAGQDMAQDASETSGDAADGADSTDIADSTDLADAVDAMDAADVVDTADAMDAAEVTDAADATNTGDSGDSQDTEIAQDQSDTAGACTQAPIALLSNATFAVLAGSSVTSTGLTTITGDVGVSPGSAVSGFLPGIIVGAVHAGDSVSALAMADLTTAYNDAAGRTLCPVTINGNLGGQTLAPGLYKSTSSVEISSGDLTLDAKGDATAVFIIQVASTLTTTAGRKVFLVGNAKAANVFWQVGSSATLGTTSVMHGTILADQAITMKTGAVLTGRLLARIAAVSLDSNAIVLPPL